MFLESEAKRINMKQNINPSESKIKEIPKPVLHSFALTIRIITASAKVELSNKQHIYSCNRKRPQNKYEPNT